MGMLDMFKKKNNDDMMLDLPSGDDAPFPGEAPEIINPFEDDSNGMSAPEFTSNDNGFMSGFDDDQESGMIPPAPAPIQAFGNSNPSNNNYNSQNNFNDSFGQEDSGSMDFPESTVPRPDDRFNNDINNIPVPQVPPRAPQALQATQAPRDPPFAQDDDFNSPASESIVEDMDVPEFPSFADKYGTRPGQDISSEAPPEDLFISNQDEDINSDYRNEEQEDFSTNDNTQFQKEDPNEIDAIFGKAEQGEDRYSLAPSKRNDYVDDSSNQVIDNNFGLFNSSELSDPNESSLSDEDETEDEDQDLDEPFNAGFEANDYTKKVEENYPTQQTQILSSQENIEASYIRPRLKRQDISGPVFCSMENCEKMTENVIYVRDAAKDTEERITLFLENEKELAGLYADWKKEIEFIQSKLFTIDKKIFS